MRDYRLYRGHLAVKRLVTAGLRLALELTLSVRRLAGGRLAGGRLAHRRPAGPTGSVVLLDRCLGIGDALMISPVLRLLAPLGPVTVVAALPPLLDWDGEWLTCSDWAGMTAAVNRLADDGRRLLAPRLGLMGLLVLLRWPGGVPAGVIRLAPRTWLDTRTGRRGAVTGRHYTDGALACARALVAGESGNQGSSSPPLPLAAPPARLPPRLAPQGADAVLAAAGLPPGRSLVALAPWATSRIRRWPPGHWSRLIERLAVANPQTTLVLLGSADERPAGDEISRGPTGQAGQGSAVVNLMGRLSLAETAAVVARAALLVACDNGILHLGLGVGTPVVALFGSTDPAARLVGSRFRLAADPGLCPRGLAPCYPDLHRDPSCPTAIECLSGLTPERVAGLALELLAAPLETERGQGRT